jgi:hypothetical protein
MAKTPWVNTLEIELGGMPAAPCPPEARTPIRGAVHPHGLLKLLLLKYHCSHTTAAAATTAATTTAAAAAATALHPASTLAL